MAVNTETPNTRRAPIASKKRVVLRAPRTRVWRASATRPEFGTWFRVNSRAVYRGKAVRAGSASRVTSM